MLASRTFALAVSLLIVISASGQVPANHPSWLPKDYDYTAPFFAGATYDTTILTPKQILGFELGDRPVLHADIQKCFKSWASSPKFKLVAFGESHERRTLYYATITSEANHAKLDDIHKSIAKLADPRKLRDDAEGQAIIKGTPAIAWMAYCIHGDELSGSDAALALAYHLIASKDADVAKMLENTVICIDPLQNPDGRDRFIQMCDQAAGYTPNLDSDAVQHAGRWPRGRTNHYFFDMNRDWIYSTQPETRARQAAIVAWQPQLLVDGHEMGHESSFLFNPARDPFNPGLSPLIRKWWNTFADNAGKSFDAHGWSYYTREWADFWYPGYTDGWATLHGTIGILYEQARTGGRAVMLPTGRVLTYREAVHHQATVSWSNLNSLLTTREAILAEYLAQRKASLAPAAELPQTFILPPQANATRMREFLEQIANQGIEIEVAKSTFSAEKLSNSLRESFDKKEFPAGSVIVRRKQPLSPLVEANLGFDPRMDKAFLDSERKELETKRNSRLYDITGWSPVMASGLEAYWAAGGVNVQTEPYVRGQTGSVTSRPCVESPYAYVLDGNDDASVRAVAFMLQAGVVIRVCEKEFQAGGRTWPRGSFLIRRHENAADFEKKLADAVAAASADYGIATTARSPDDTPDLGGEHFFLLRTPRVALVGDGGGDTQTYGAIWHYLDREVGLAVSLQDGNLGGVDLRRFNVLIVPSARGALRNQLDDIQTWVRNGGTLIAIGDAAEFLADEKHKLSSVRRRPDVLKSLDEDAAAAALERSAGHSQVDVAKLWDDVAEVVPMGQAIVKPETKLTDEALDDWRRIFSPTGAILRGTLNSEHWLTFGAGLANTAPLAPASTQASTPTSTSSPSSGTNAASPYAPGAAPSSTTSAPAAAPVLVKTTELPLFAAGSTVLLSKSPVTTPVRFADAKRLRMSGLMWPESAVRIENSAYATVERVGAGQVILFAQDPIFRGGWRGTGRLLLNAILLGPGCGTSQPNP